MTLMARWSGVCPECGEKWQPGDLIRAEGGPRAPLGDAIWQHATCPDPLATEHPVCTECWLTHPAIEGACDR